MITNYRHTKKLGFTFVELIFAITIMGIMFALTLTVIVGMLRFYVFANNIRLNQQNGRNIMDSIVRDVRFSTILTPAGYSKSNSICIKKPDNTLTKYSQNNLAIWKTVYAFDVVVSPSSCPDNDSDLPPNTTIKKGPTKISLDNMKVYTDDFSFTRAEGSIPSAFTNITSLVINFKFFTGNPIDAVKSGSCLTNDIYCSSLQLNTAVGIKNNQI